MMWRKFLILAMALAFGTILSTLRATGADGFKPCEQQDLEGTWSVRIGATDGFGRHTCWEQCNLTIGSDGMIEEGGIYVDCSGVSSQITGGQLTISSGCVIEGEICTSNGTSYIRTGAIMGDELVLGKAEY